MCNRSEGRTKPLTREGSIAAAAPAEAELGSGAVITMLFDDAVYEDVLFGASGLVAALSPGALHISCSTISAVLSERLTVEYANRGIDFVGAPLFGRPRVAGEGRLSVVAAGAAGQLELCLAESRFPFADTAHKCIGIHGFDGVYPGMSSGTVFSKASIQEVGMPKERVNGRKRTWEK